MPRGKKKIFLPDVTPKNMNQEDFMKMNSVKSAFKWLMEHRYTTYGGLRIEGISKEDCIVRHQKNRNMSQMQVYVGIECPKCHKKFIHPLFKVKNEYKSQKLGDVFHVDCELKSDELNNLIEEKDKVKKYKRLKTAKLFIRHGFARANAYGRLKAMFYRSTEKNGYEIDELWKLEKPNKFFDYETGEANREKIKNFINFIQNQLNVLGYDINSIEPKDYSVKRIDKHGEFGPNNCYVKLKWLSRDKSLELLHLN